MLTDFSDIWWECTWLYLQHSGIFFFRYMIQQMQRYHDIWNGKVFKQLRHAMQGRTMQKNGQNIQIIL